MLDVAESTKHIHLTDLIDELSTRMIIDGAGTLVSADFETLALAAASGGHDQIAAVATNLAGSIAPGTTFSLPELTRLLSSGLVELRNLLDKPAAPPTPATVQDGPTRTVVENGPGIPGPDSLAADEELIVDFITESKEHLVSIESKMLVLEKDSGATETLNAIFRGFHTIKGLAGFLGFAGIQALAHEVETLLDLARTSQLAVTPFVVDVVLESTDVVRQELTAIELRLSGKEPPPTRICEALLERVRTAARVGKNDDSRTAAIESLTSSALSVGETGPNSELSPDESLPSLDVEKQILPPEINTPPVEPELPRQVLQTAAKAESAATGLLKSPTEVAKPMDSASVRIDTAKLDQLMDMVGEMVIAQTLIGHSPALASLKDPRFMRDLAQLARITSDVQRITTGMRMVPIGLQFQKTARLIRDLSRRAGKQIVLETSGEDTELDKTIAEELSDPLLHMVRNSIDHGIETPEERTALGKDPTAHIRVAAYHQSGQIVVAISDDGRGLNREKILAKALQNGLVPSGAQLTDNEIFMLIFEPGFSTADKVTDISGRGVGMDVVRKHVQKLRGRIDIQSKQGEGTTFYLKLPLTLAIIEGLVVVVGDQRYIVPIFSVKEMFRPTPEMISTVQGTGEMAMVRGGLMPVVRLHRRFAVEPRTTDLTQGTLVVAESVGHKFCLFVDDLVGKQEVVIKSLGQSFKHVAGIAGCAILGDGRVGLILDIDGIFKGRAS